MPDDSGFAEPLDADQPKVTRRAAHGVVVRERPPGGLVVRVLDGLAATCRAA
jgi:hypothetical protein